MGPIRRWINLSWFEERINTKARLFDSPESVEKTNSANTWSTEIGTVAAPNPLTMQAQSGGKETPSSGANEAGSQVSIWATPSGGYLSCGWVGSGSGAHSGTNKSATITMNAPIAETALFYLACPSVPPP